MQNCMSMYHFIFQPNTYFLSFITYSYFCYRETGSSGGSGSPNGIGKRSKRSFQSKTFKVELSFATKIPMKSIFTALKGAEVDNGHSQDALRVLDIILRQQAANR